MIVLDDGGVVQSWDHGAECLFGFAPGDAVGRLLDELIIPEWLRHAHRRGFARFVSDLQHRRRPWTSTVPAVTATGEELSLDLDVVSVDVDGVHRTVGFIRESATPRSPTRFPALFEALFARAPEIITMIDAEGIQQGVNEASSRMLGYEPSHSPIDGYRFIHPEDRATVTEHLRQLSSPSSGIDRGVRYRVLDANGDWRWLESLTADLLDVVGVECQVLFSRDVTEAEAQRAELAEARAAAEAIAAQLLDSDRARNSFVASVSHELRTPLTALMSGTELLLDDADAPLDPAVRETVQLVQRNVERLARLIENLLLVERLQVGVVHLEAIDLDIGTIVAEAVSLMTAVAESRDVTIRIDVAPGPPTHGEHSQIVAVIENLLGNAIKYTDPGTEVTIRARYQPEGWTVTVHDHGPGLAPGEEQHVFERFTRGSAAADGQVPGSGLGLALSRAIAEFHGGTLDSVPHRGRGSTFRLRLPAEPPAWAVTP